MWTLILILLPIIAIFSYIFYQRKEEMKKVQSAKNDVKEIPNKKTNSNEKPQKKEKPKNKPKKPLKEIEQRLSTAEKAIFIGKTLPTSISFAKDNSCFVISCQGHQHLLFARSAIDNEGNPSQRYNINQDGVVDSALVTNPDLQLILCIDRIRDPGIQSYHIGLDKSQATPSTDFLFEKAHNYTIKKVRASDDGAFFATLGDDTHFNIVTQNGQKLLSNDTRSNEAYELAVSHDFVTISGYISSLVVYGIKRNEHSETPIKATRAFSVGHKNSVNTVDFRPGTMEMVTGSQDNSFIVWLTPERWAEDDIARNLWHFNVGEKIKMVRAAPKSDFVAVLTNSQKLLFYNKEGLQKTVENPHPFTITHMEWTADGKGLTVLSVESYYLYAYASP